MNEDITEFKTLELIETAIKSRSVDPGEFLSTYAEVHAFIIGIYAGLTEWKGIDSELMKNLDVAKEPHYAYGGYIVGTAGRIIIILIVGSAMI